MSKPEDPHAKVETKPAAQHAPGAPPEPAHDDPEKQIEALREKQKDPSITREEFGELSKQIVALMEGLESKKTEKASAPKHP